MITFLQLYFEYIKLCLKLNELKTIVDTSLFVFYLFLVIIIRYEIIKPLYEKIISGVDY